MGVDAIGGGGIPPISGPVGPGSDSSEASNAVANALEKLLEGEWSGNLGADQPYLSQVKSGLIGMAGYDSPSVILAYFAAAMIDSIVLGNSATTRKTFEVMQATLKEFQKADVDLPTAVKNNLHKLMTHEFDGVSIDSLLNKSFDTVSDIYYDHRDMGQEIEQYAESLH